MWTDRRINVECLVGDYIKAMVKINVVLIYFSYSFRRVYFQNIIMHGIPDYGNGSTFEFCLKIYQGYHLKHTTKP